jgi:hypothetical protein
VDALSALIAQVLAGLRATVAPEFCPGGWAWATTLLGLGVGLLPAVGAVVGARLRRHSGDGAGPVTAGLLTAGLLPWVALTATGQVFASAAAGTAVPGLGRADLRDLGRRECLGAAQGDYLGTPTVGGAFALDRPLLLGLAVLVFGMLPLVAALFSGLGARLALRGGPRSAAKAFWLPMLALPFVTAGAPAGSSAHLWLGIATGTVGGVVAVLILRPAPARPRAAVQARLRPAPARSIAAPVPARPPTAQRPPTGQRPPTAQRPFTAQGPFTAQRPPTAQGPTPAGAAARWKARWGPHAQRLADRFASRAPVPPVVLPPEHAAAPPAAPLTPPPPPPPAAPVAGTPPRRPTLLLPDQRGTARFRVVRRLGSGGFGRVWLAEDARLGHLVALKAAHAPDEHTEQRIHREAKALAAVRHPYCVRIFDLVDARSDAGLADLSGLVLVMEYLAGASLAQQVRDRGVLDDVAAGRIWAGLADGLSAAHRRGVLHRDVKPGNVVVGDNGLAHLIDFGIARTTGDATLTLAGWIIGTPDFLAPEVAGGASATPASDAWQLAATLSFAMTGHPPRGVHDDVQSGLRAAAAGAPLTALPTRTAHAALLRAALDTDPANRPSLDDVHAALGAWLERTAPGTRATTPR